MEKPKLRKLIFQILTEKPEARGSNDLLTYLINKHLINHHNIQTADGFAMAMYGGLIPNQHTIAAALSVVKRLNPELKETPEQREKKLQKQEEFINDSRAAQEQVILNQN